MLFKEGFIFYKKNTYMSIEDIYSIYLQHPVISTDTRNIQKNSIFFCLKGQSFNGNTFASEALTKGAAFVVMDEQAYAVNDKCIVVDHALKTLQELALYHRQQLRIPFIGITGTNGKTTTKELIKTVLSQKYKVLATQGNFNNHIGVPLTILSINNKVEIAVIEMGANHAGEIDDLCKIALPDYGIITNIGKAHLEGFLNIETIIETKTALYKAVKNVDGTIFINMDDKLLMSNADTINKITYGTTESTDYYGKVISDGFLCKVFLPKTLTTISTQLTGDYNFSNIMAAVAVGQYFNISIPTIQQAINSYQPSNSRSQILKKRNNIFIMDAYNANPSSMKPAIINFANIEHENKALILGDMKELGNESLTEHQQIVDLLITLSFKQVFLIGPEFSKTKHPKGWSIETWDEALHIISHKNIQQAMILVKGSRSMQMERILSLY